MNQNNAYLFPTLFLQMKASVPNNEGRRQGAEYALHPRGRGLFYIMV